MDQLLILFLCCLSCVFGICAAARFEALPKISIKDLDWRTFDNEFLNRRAVIIEGFTHCPSNFSLGGILRVCRGSSPIQVYNMASHAEDAPDDWQGRAGLGINQTTTLEEYVKRLQEGAPRSPTYGFAFQLPQYCPWALDTMNMAAHLVGNFEEEWLCDWRHVCDGLHGVRAYLNSMHFSTSLHTDAYHASFYSSMCEGRKMWRIVNNDNLFRHRDEFKPYLKSPGVEVNGKLALATLRGSFETWSAQSFLQGVNVTVYEGIQEPGSVLYVPAGALHAAKTLTNLSVMVSTNEHSFEDLQVFHKICSKRKTREIHPTIESECRMYANNRCADSAQTKFFPKWRQNRKRFGSLIVRKHTPLLEVAGCSPRVKLCEFMENMDPAWDTYCAGKAQVEL